MTGSAEHGPEWQRHIGNKPQRRKLAVDAYLTFSDRLLTRRWWLSPMW